MDVDRDNSIYDLLFKNRIGIKPGETVSRYFLNMLKQ